METLPENLQVHRVKYNKEKKGQRVRHGDAVKGVDFTFSSSARIKRIEDDRRLSDSDDKASTRKELRALSLWLHLIIVISVVRRGFINRSNILPVVSVGWPASNGEKSNFDDRRLEFFFQESVVKKGKKNCIIKTHFIHKILLRKKEEKRTREREREKWRKKKGTFAKARCVFSTLAFVSVFAVNCRRVHSPLRWFTCSLKCELFSSLRLSFSLLHSSIFSSISFFIFTLLRGRDFWINQAVHYPPFCVSR